MSAQLGPGDGTIQVKTYREGAARKVGHDLIIDVTGWGAMVGDDAVTLKVDPRSLQVREGHNGLKPLSDKDRAEIVKNIDDKVLGGEPITFRSTSVERAGDRLTADGELTMAGQTRPAKFELAQAGGRLSGTLVVTQSDFGIKPFKAFMGALKVRDDVEIVIDVTLPA